jgi:ribonuclease HIII
LEFEEYINRLEETLCSLGNVQTKSINYGVQIVLTAAGKKVTLNAYNGKKGISLVWGGENSELQDQAIDLVHQIQLQNKKTYALGNREGNVSLAGPASVETLHFSSAQPCFLLAEEPGFSGIWLGSDESGKGDYFGPLVVAAVCLDRKGGEALLAAGVKDCKTLTDEKVLALGNVIQETALAFSVLVMKPRIYNMRYEQVQKEGGSLNTLLALGHVAALKQAWQKYPRCKWALVDQFAKNNDIPDGMHAFAPEMKVLQRPRAEQDIAVASASVLARAAFLQALQQMAPEAGIGRIPKGGGEAATNAARRLVQKQGMEVLERFVKLHFANTKKLWEIE